MQGSRVSLEFGMVLGLDKFGFGWGLWGVGLWGWASAFVKQVSETQHPD